MKRRLFATIALVGLLLFSTGVSAQSGGGQGLEISPPLVELKADPGQTITTEVRVRNVTQDTLVTRAQVNDFVADGEDGKPKLLLEEGEESPYSIKNWVVAIPSVTLKKGEQKAIKVVLRVPANAGPGGHFGVVRFTGTPPELEDTGVSLSASVGTLLLVNVSGATTEKARIAEMFSSQNGKQGGWFEYGPITITERIQNDGNVYFKPTGNVRITNAFGKEVVNFQLNEQGGNVLPGSIRRFEQTLDKKLLFGRYTAQADVVYGSQNTIISESITFWVIPYKLLAIAIFGIIILIFLIRRYNRYIVKKAQGRTKNNDRKSS